MSTAIRTRATVLEALRHCPTLADAARSVRLSVNELRLFAWSQGLGGEFRRLELGRRAA